MNKPRQNLSPQQSRGTPKEDRPGPRVLVLGGHGFIGRHIVKELARHNLPLLLGVRCYRANSAHRQRVLRLQHLTRVSDWKPALMDVDVVINAVGILRERAGESYEAIHHLAVGALAKACEHLTIKLIHISALGLENPVRSAFARSKKNGEQAIMSGDADWHIVRASLVEGEGAYGATWFKRIAQWPVHFVPKRNALIAPVAVERIAEKVRELVRQPSSARIHELSNGIKYRLPDYLAALNHGVRRPVVRVPDFLVCVVTWFCDALNLTPLTAGHRELLSFDNCPVNDILPEYPAARSPGERQVPSAS